MITKINNSASLTYNFGELSDTAASNVATTNLLEDYSLSAVKLSNNSNWRPSENLTYIVRIENNGIEPIYNVSIQDNLGNSTNPLLTFVPESVMMNSNGVLTSLTPTNTSPLTIALPNTLEAGEVVTVTYVAKVRSDIDASITEITNEATVAGHEGSATGTVITADPTPSITLPKADYAQLKMEKNVDKTEISSGDTLTYSFKLENSGNMEATNAVLVDNLPPSFTIGEIKSETNGVITTFIADDYSVDLNNKLILPTSATKTISVPAATTSGNGVTTVTISGTINS